MKKREPLEKRRPARTEGRHDLEPHQKRAAFLEDIIIYGQNIRKLASTMNFATFVEDGVRQKAILYDLLSVGETIKTLNKIAPSMLDRHPHVDWGNLIGFRDISAHKYFEMDHELVWDTVQRYLPPAIEAAMKELENLLPALP